MTRPMPSGTCQLMGTIDMFAKSHIIPDAFMQRVTELYLSRLPLAH